MLEHRCSPVRLQAGGSLPLCTPHRPLCCPRPFHPHLGHGVDAYHDVSQTLGSFVKPSVMVNIICPLAWVKAYPDSWLNMICGCVCEGVSRRY